MTNSHIDPRQFNGPLQLDSKWLPGHEDEGIFAKFNSDVITLIHEEKRFPTKEELTKIHKKTLPPDPVDFSLIFSDPLKKETIFDYKPVGNLWGNLSDVFGPGVSIELSGTSPSVGNTTVTIGNTTTYGEPVPFNGITWTDFIQNEDLSNTDFRASALASTKGVTEKNLEHRLI